MQTYDKKKVNAPKGGRAAQTAPVQQSVPNSAFLTDGASRIDLPEAMRSKMESAYGTDLSAVKIYQSQKVADGGAEAVTMGNTIAFAPGKFDMTSQSGQALLGHEMSHVVSQSRGEVQGNGVVENAALEARADREGAMAAAGEQVYNGPVTAPISSASPAAMAGPMQCKKASSEVNDLVRAKGEDGGVSEANVSRIYNSPKLYAAFQKKHKSSKGGTGYMDLRYQDVGKRLKERAYADNWKRSDKGKKWDQDDNWIGDHLKKEKKKRRY